MLSQLAKSTANYDAGGAFLAVQTQPSLTAREVGLTQEHFDLSMEFAGAGFDVPASAMR